MTKEYPAINIKKSSEIVNNAGRYKTKYKIYHPAKFPLLAFQAIINKGKENIINTTKLCKLSNGNVPV